MVATDPKKWHLLYDKILVPRNNCGKCTSRRKKSLQKKTAVSVLLDEKKLKESMCTSRTAVSVLRDEKKVCTKKLR